LYIAASLPELLAIMHIYFPDTADQEMMRRNVTPISPRPYLIMTPLQSTLSERPSSNRKILLGGKSNRSTDFDSLFADFIGGANAGIDLPLAVALVRRIGRMQASSAEEGQTSEDAEESKHPDSTWKPLYMKCREAKMLHLMGIRVQKGRGSSGGPSTIGIRLKKSLQNTALHQQ
jgi:hypothetical protein